MSNLLKIEEVAVILGCSTQTINYWYRWKKENPDSEFAKMLPDFIQEGNRQTRFWKQEDVKYLAEFKNTIPQGRNGILGSITQKYYHKNKEEVT